MPHASSGAEECSATGRRPRERPVHRHVEVLNEDDPVLEMSWCRNSMTWRNIPFRTRRGVRLAAEDDLDRRSGSPRMRARRSGLAGTAWDVCTRQSARRNRCERVSASRLHRRPRDASVAPRRRAARLRRTRVNSMSRARARHAHPTALRLGPSSSFHESGDPGVVFQLGPSRRSRSSSTSVEIHDLKWMPLVTCPIGNLAQRQPRQSPPHWLRVTPRATLTPLRAPDSRRASTVGQKESDGSSGL